METGELTLTCLYAGEDFGGKDRNSHSLVLCGDYKGFHMLFTGDMGKNRRAVWSDWQNRRGPCRIYI